LRLSAEQLARLEGARKGYREIPGGVYALERDREGPHGRIMKYGLQQGAGR
jgi:hypothetical protein